MQQHLHVFVKVVEQKSFSRAAEQLHMTQPAVSQYIKLLEQNYGQKLLDRTNKYVYLTKAGEVVYFHAKEILGLYAKMHRLVDDLSNHPRGQLSIGASFTFGEYVLPHIIAEMHKIFPEIKPSIIIGNTKEIIELVERHQLDIGIIEGDVKKGQAKIEQFAEDQMFIVASRNHPLSEGGLVKSHELMAERWIVREPGSGTREATEKLFRDFSMSPSEIMEFGSTQVIKESVESGLGISLLSKFAIRKEVAMGLLKVIEVEGAPYKRNFSIALGTSFQTKAVQIFINLLKDMKSTGDSIHHAEK